jgi:pyridine nucleotide-disulfide oxidoreductase family protein
MKRLLLLGGGHAHLRVLRQLARAPLVGWDVALVTPQPQAIYSGMLPGWVAGHYRLEQCAIDLLRLAAAARVRPLLGEVWALDAGSRSVQTREGATLEADLISIDVGSMCAHDGIEGAREHAVPVRPIAGFVGSWRELQRRLGSGGEALHLAVVGAGPGGVELALAARHRALVEGWSGLHVHLVGRDERPLTGAPEPVGERMLQLLRQRGIRWHGGRTVREIRPGGVVLEGGEVLPAQACWLATGPAAHPWLAAGGLATDAQGFVQVRSTLQTLTRHYVFVAGDAASHAHAMPKSGVYAVRSGAVLARNLLATCRGQPLVAWQPPGRALYLLSTADRRALALWGRWHWESGWLWGLKDAIDRRFIGAHAR